jgi:hypothetical protein
MSKISKKLEETLNEAMNETVSEAIQAFANKIAEKHSLDVDELMTLFDSNCTVSSKPKTKTKTKAKAKATKSSPLVDMEDLSIERLSKCSVAELKALCSSKSLKVSGKKEELVNRLLGKDGEKSSSKSTKQTEKPKAEKKSKVPSKADRSTGSISVINQLVSKLPVTAIRKNKFGNLEHNITKLVFDSKTKKATGKQNDDGTISELTDEDIQQCRKYKFEFVLPSNLDKGNLDKVNIEELDEGEDDLEKVIKEDKGIEEEGEDDDVEDIIEEEDDEVEIEDD